MEWTRITRGDVDLRINSRYREMLDAEIELSAAPPPAWERAFANPNGVEISGGGRAPSLSGSTVYLLIAHKDLEASVREVDARIAFANGHYEQSVLRELQREEAQRQEDQRADKALLDDARRRARKL